MTVGPGGASAVVSYPAEEQIYYVIDGAGTLGFYSGAKDGGPHDLILAVRVFLPRGAPGRD